MQNPIEIDGKKFLIKELKVKELLFICVKAGWIPPRPEFDIPVKKGQPLYEIALSFASDMKPVDLISLFPSDVKKLYDIFMETNQVTFDVLEYLDLKRMIEELKSSLVNGFISDYSDLLKKTQDQSIPLGGKVVAAKK